MKRVPVGVYVGEALARYGFPRGHPFGPDRLAAFWSEARRRGLDLAVEQRDAAPADRTTLVRFHDEAYIERVAAVSRRGAGLLDAGDTPAFPGCFEAAATVVGAGVDAARAVVDGALRRALIPVGGLHHARRDRAGGFCIFNDCGVVIETLRRQHGVRRVAYVDIDAHHGDGVLYAFADDPELWIADIHEDGRFIYPGSGFAHETGVGPAVGTKLNLPLQPGADDRAFIAAWQQAEAHLERARPEIVLLQCGADSLAGDPLTHLELTVAAHARAASSLVTLAERFARGRLIAFGGGGYDRDNLASAWCAVLEQLLQG